MQRVLYLRSALATDTLGGYCVGVQCTVGLSIASARLGGELRDDSIN